MGVRRLFGHRSLSKSRIAKISEGTNPKLIQMTRRDKIIHVTHRAIIITINIMKGIKLVISAYLKDFTTCAPKA